MGFSAEDCRVIFLGTPAFAVPSLEALLISGYNIKLIVTQPDRQSGRNRLMTPPALKNTAISLGLPVFQPNKVNDVENLYLIENLKPDLLIVGAFGEILSKELLCIPKYGALNLHPSLLPKYRGPSPVASAILAGEKETGLSIMLMDEGLDNGDILLQEILTLNGDETSVTLTAKLSKIGAICLIEILPKWIDGSLKPFHQDGNKATYSKIISKNDGEIDWRKSAKQIEREMRAFNPWPGSFTYWRKNVLKIIGAKAIENHNSRETPGKVQYEKDLERLVVTTGDGSFIIEEIQLSGKRIMDSKKFYQGHKEISGEFLGREKISP